MFKSHFKYNYLYKQINYILNAASKRNLSLAKQQDKREDAIIKCRRKEYDYYKGQKYGKLDDINLASKGWTHNKSKGDYFTIHPQSTEPDLKQFSLDHFNFNENITKCLRNDGIEMLTSFQNEAITTISKGRHSILAAETGCGKTLAYLLPILNKIVDGKLPGVNTPKALILVPGRELAYQIGSVAQQFADEMNLKIKIVVGGRIKQIMLNPEFSEVDLLIGTPGAIGKLCTVGVYKLNHVSHAVLDEADTLLDDSFIERLTGIIKRLSTSQLVLVSATMPTNIPPILEPYNSSFVNVVSPLLHKTLRHITQVFLRVGRSIKPQQLLQIVKKNQDQLLIFTNRNETCNWLSYFLKENGISSSRVNGSMNYGERIIEWNDFRSQKNRILVATDVCSRGIHIGNMRHIINYDFPLYVADYLHRIGRTGRFGEKSCKVTNFVAGDQEVKIVQKIELAIRRNEPIQNVDGNITGILHRKLLRSGETLM